MALVKEGELREPLIETILSQAYAKAFEGATTIRKEYTQASGSALRRKVMI